MQKVKTLSRFVNIGICACLCLSFFLSCQEGVFFERNKVIPNQSWDNTFKPDFTIDVKDKQAKYDLYASLRHTAYYPFSNIYFLLHEKGPGIIDTAHRYEIALAESDGRWIGQSAGNLYEQTQILKENFSFPDTGKFVFYIEQNMSDNPLRGINDVGLKVIKR